MDIQGRLAMLEIDEQSVHHSMQQIVLNDPKIVYRFLISEESG